MTLPDERSRAVLQALAFLRDLLDRQKTPRVPREVRDRAGRILKHYPTHYDMRYPAEMLAPVLPLDESPSSVP
jgi:hypothetical protein